MTRHRMQQRITKVAVTMTEREMRVHIGAKPKPLVTPFAVKDDEIIYIADQYTELDRLADPAQGGTDAEYEKLERELGRYLARILLYPDGASKNSLGIILHRYLPKDEGRYIRLMLSIEHEPYAALPWELALWRHPGAETEVYIGQDPRIALTRCHLHLNTSRRRIWGTDGAFSILHVGADDSEEGNIHYGFISKFLWWLDEHIPRLHTTSRRFRELKEFFDQSEKLVGQLPEFDIVHWRGHGDSKGVSVPTDKPDDETLSAGDVVRLTRRAFLYVMLTCDSGHRIPIQQTHLKGPERLATASSFSSALLGAGAPVVLAMYDTVDQKEFDHLPILYQWLFRGLPLDYSVQWLRRFFAESNAARGPLPRAGWQKLMLHTTSDRFLNGPQAIARTSHQNPSLAAEADMYRGLRLLGRLHGAADAKP